MCAWRGVAWRGVAWRGVAKACRVAVEAVRDEVSDGLGHIERHGHRALD